MRDITRKISGKRAFQAEGIGRAKTLRQDAGQNVPEAASRLVLGELAEDIDLLQV